jgi:hypothetical protein
MRPLEQDDLSSNRHPALYYLFEHDLRANAFAFVPRENRFPLFRIMLYALRSANNAPQNAIVAPRQSAARPASTPDVVGIGLGAEAA